jgi:hypothetical protein
MCTNLAQLVTTRAFLNVSFDQRKSTRFYVYLNDFFSPLL